jgi:hypothetical protein
VILPDLEKQSEGFIQTEAINIGFRLQESKGNCPEFWTLRGSFLRDIEVVDLTVKTLRSRRRRCRSSQNSLLPVRVRKQSISFGVWKASFGSVTPKSLFWYLSPMLSSWQRKKRVRWLENRPHYCFAEDTLAEKRWNQEKLTEKLEQGSSILKSVYR